MDKQEAYRKLVEGNLAYLASSREIGDISPAVRLRTTKEGQEPFAIIISCSDSRVIPEAIFHCGIGDLFVIRVAGNVIDSHQLGSIEYAADHLGTKLVVVLGHTNCGAVGAAIHHDPSGYIKFITDEIRTAIGEETDPYKAACLNVTRSRKLIEEGLKEMIDRLGDISVVGAMYDIETGKVEFLPE